MYHVKACTDVTVRHLHVTSPLNILIMHQSTGNCYWMQHLYVSKHEKCQWIQLEHVFVSLSSPIVHMKLSPGHKICANYEDRNFLNTDYNFNEVSLTRRKTDANWCMIIKCTKNTEYNFQKCVSKQNFIKPLPEKNFQGIDCWSPMKRLYSKSNIGKESANYSSPDSNRHTDKIISGKSQNNSN